MIKRLCACIATFSMLYGTTAKAIQLGDHLSIDGNLTAVTQYLGPIVSNARSGNAGGVVTLDVGANFRPAPRHEFQLTVSAATGNSLEDRNPFSLAVYADDLENDLENINSRDRDYLLEAWYKHTFDIFDHATLGVTLGVIDATAYLDDNQFANDEVTQFMNATFVNNTLANLPTYDIGAVVDLEIGDWSARALIMESKNDDGRYFRYGAGQLGYHAQTSLGEGIYRIYGFSTDNEFNTTSGNGTDNLVGLGISLDQRIGDSVGFFSRIAFQDDSVAIAHNWLASIGMAVDGRAWHRDYDTVGLGFAFLDGAKGAGIDHTTAVEAYYRVTVYDHLELTLDAQFLLDHTVNGENALGTIIGIRLNSNF